MQTAELLIEIGLYYLYCGGAVAAIFLVIGIERVEPSAQGSYAFRPLLIPGICLIWPLVLYRWFHLEREKEAEE
ncbi:hypothetical protein [Roseibium sp.]|uniref:hypothetical protein n=1 Tax=Roseibium sp. TaxID=1936156 RepID=UPI003B519C15